MTTSPLKVQEELGGWEQCLYPRISFWVIIHHDCHHSLLNPHLWTWDGQLTETLGDQAGSSLLRGWRLWTVWYALLPLVLTRLCCSSISQPWEPQGATPSGRPAVHSWVWLHWERGASSAASLRAGAGPRLEWGPSGEGCCGEKAPLILRKLGSCSIF